MLGALALGSCGREALPGRSPQASSVGDAPQAWFEDQASSRGLDFVWQSGHREAWNMPEIMGGGAALFDPDGDGDLDLYTVQGGDCAPREGASHPNPPNRFYRNTGGGQFVDETEISGADDRGYGMGVCVGDLDGDGREDLYVTNVQRICYASSSRRPRPFAWLFWASPRLALLVF